MHLSSIARNILIAILLLKPIHLFLLLNTAKCTSDSTSNPLGTAPPHRGAARQMYGSGSLRPAGTKPVYAIGQRKHGIRTTVSPTDPLNHRRVILPPMQPYPIIPYSIPMREYDRLPGGYPIFISPEVLQRITSSSRSGLDRPSNRGMYGGRPEYYGGRPNHGLGRSRYPIDLGFLGGKGFGKQPTDLGVPRVGRYPANKGILVHSGNSKLKYEDEEDDDKVSLKDHPCGEDCARGEYLCIRSCICIKDVFR